MTGESSASMPRVSQMLRRSAGKAEGPNRNAGRELPIVANSAPFRLPDDWFVELKPRSSTSSSPGRVHKYYYEPRTGRKFRSLVAVERYLTEEKQDTPTPKTVKEGNDKNMQNMACTIRSTSSFKLPDAWVIEEKPRSNINYAGVIDKCYIEPGTGQRFRSLKAVERYLTEENKNTATPKNSQNSASRKKNTSSDMQSLRVVRKYQLEAEEDTITLKALKLSNRSTPSKKSASRKKNISSKDVSTSMLHCANPPAKINWVLSGPGGNIWSAFINETIVPESVKQKWSETFVTTIDGRNLMHQVFE